MLRWKGRNPKSTHDWPPKAKRTPEEPDFQQAIDEHHEYVLYPQKALLQPSGRIVKKQKKVKFCDQHDLALRQPIIDQDHYQPYGLFQPLTSHDWVGRDLTLRQAQVDRWVADHAEFKKRIDQPPPDKNHDFPVIAKLHNKFPPENDEQRPLPVERRDHVTKQKASIEKGWTYQWELEVAWAKLWAADNMCPRTLRDEDLRDEHVHDKDMNFHNMSIKYCLEEIQQVKSDIKRELVHLEYLKADIFDTEQIFWARSKHWEIPEEWRITQVSTLHLPVEHWERQAEQAREREQAAQAAAEAASTLGKFKAGLKAVNAVITGDAVVSAFGGIRPSRRNIARKNVSREAPIKPTPQTTSAASSPKTSHATSSSPASRSWQSLSWRSSMATLSSTLVSSASPAPIPRTGQDFPPANGSIPQGTQPIEINLPNRMKEARQHLQDTPIPQGTQPIDINFPIRIQTGRGLVRPQRHVPEHSGPGAVIQARGALPRRANFTEIPQAYRVAEAKQNPVRVNKTAMKTVVPQGPPLEFARSVIPPSHMRSEGPSLLSKSLAARKSTFVIDVEDDDDDECAIIDEEEEEGSKVEDKIEEPDKDEESDENMDKEPDDVDQEEEDVDPAEDSDVGSIPEHMTRGQILRRPSDPCEEEAEDEAYEGDVDSGEESGIKLDDEEQQTDELDDGNESLEGRPDRSCSSSMVAEVDSDSAWETVSEGDSDEEDASDEEASDGEQEAE